MSDYISFDLTIDLRRRRENEALKKRGPVMLVSPGQLLVISILSMVALLILALFGFLLHVTILVLIGCACLVARWAWAKRTAKPEPSAPAPLPGAYHKMTDDEQIDFLRRRGYR